MNNQQESLLKGIISLIFGMAFLFLCILFICTSIHNFNNIMFSIGILLLGIASMSIGAKCLVESGEIKK